MQPLHRLLHRIRWDPEFAKGEFALGYFDRIIRAEKIVPFRRVEIDPHWPGIFSFRDEDGAVSRIPLHRVRTVYRDGVILWQRPSRTG
jgi:uncharacterized protein (UPF0248 family)